MYYKFVLQYWYYKINDKFVFKILYWVHIYLLQEERLIWRSLMRLLREFVNFRTSTISPLQDGVCGPAYCLPRYTEFSKKIRLSPRSYFKVIVRGNRNYIVWVLCGRLLWSRRMRRLAIIRWIKKRPAILPGAFIPIQKSLCSFDFVAFQATGAHIGRFYFAFLDNFYFLYIGFESSSRLAVTVAYVVSRGLSLLANGTHFRHI